ncbi:hypothetical protein ABBQ38_007955 [Trebouxia sp. C0009 RCD-2024]
MEVLGIQARDALRYLQKKVAKSGCVGYADHSFVVALDSADQFGLYFMDSSCELPSDGPQGAEPGRLPEPNESGCTASVEERLGTVARRSFLFVSQALSCPWQKALGAYGTMRYTRSTIRWHTSG